MKSGNILAATVILASAASAFAQTQIRPRVLLMVDTSGSMTEQIDDTSKDTGADGSFSYTDATGIKRDPVNSPGFAYGEGFSNPANQCTPPGTGITNFRGSLSKAANAKAAVNNVLNGSGEIDWGLMRYDGDYCPIVGGGLVPRVCGGNGACLSNQCSGGHCKCTNDGQCDSNEFCVNTGLAAGAVCVTDSNLCLDGMFSMTDKRDDGTCTDRTAAALGGPGYSLPGSFAGSACGGVASCKLPLLCQHNSDCRATNGNCSGFLCHCNGNGNCKAGFACNLGFCVSTDASCTACQTPLTCNRASDCMGGACSPIANSAASACGCNADAQCPTANGYTCQSGVCTYDRGCDAAGGVIVVDPKVSGSNAKIFPWVDGQEDYTGNAGAFEVITNGISTNVAVANPELRSKGFTPLGGAARSAAAWYADIRDYTLAHPGCTTADDPRCDPKLLCRPYALVQMTDGADTCEGFGPNLADGPPAAARQFVAATVSGARVMNKVYVIGLSITSLGDQTELNNIAVGGGTTAARFANSEVEIEAALSDIVTSSVLVEKCNNADDDCNGVCDEPFPDVAVTGAGCSNPHAANTCNNGALAGTHCFASGTFQCSSDQLSEVCGAATCTGNPEDPANPSYAICPRAESMHGCNGIDDDCNGVVDDCTPFVSGSCCSSVMCPACNPTGVPQPETCNGCDDDCDGVIDDHLMDPTVGVVGGPPCVALAPGHDQPPCNPGVTACVNGMVVCQNAVGPMPNQCDGISRDCTGVANTNGSCPANFMCFQGNCATPCADTEFPCPGGFVCKMPEKLCIPDGCAKLNCPTGVVCRVADDGTASCADPCDSVTCPTGFVCQAGVCKETTCRGQGCPDGQLCLGPPPACAPDPCVGVSCPSGQFCDAAGACEQVCTTPCGSTQICVNGQCQLDPCKTTSCPTATPVCVVVNGAAQCVDSFCEAGCGAGLVCCGGQCRHDPCVALSCAGHSSCQLDDACNASCGSAGPEDQIVGAGGGGATCEMSGSGRSRASEPTLGVWLLLIAWAIARSRRPRRRGGAEGA